MYFSKKMYVDEKIDNLSELKENLLKNKSVSGVYLICTIPEDKNLAYILSAKEFLKEHNKKRNYKVMGISKGKKSALDLLEKIVNDVISSNCDKISNEEIQKFFNIDE